MSVVDSRKRISGESRRVDSNSTRKKKSSGRAFAEEEAKTSEESICFLLARFGDEISERLAYLESAGVFRAEAYGWSIAQKIVTAFPAACRLAAKRGYPVSHFTIADCVPVDSRDEVFDALKWMFDPKTEPPYHNEPHLLPVESVLGCYRRLVLARERLRLASAVRDMSSLVEATWDFDGLLELAEKSFSAYVSKCGDVETVPSLPSAGGMFCAREIASRLALPKVSTGFDTLDSLAGNMFKPGTLTFLGGTPGAGKTAFAQQIALNVAKKGTTVLFFSCELSLTDSLARLFSLSSALDAAGNAVSSESVDIARAIQNDAIPLPVFDYNVDQWNASSHKAEGLQLHTFHDSMTSADAICRKIAELIESMKVSRYPFVVVDYLQFLGRDSSLDRRLVVESSISALKSVAEKYSIPILCLSALSRVGYAEPVAMEHFKETGAIEYDADGILAIQRVDVFPRLNEAGKPESKVSVAARVKARENAERLYARGARNELLPLSRKLVVSILKSRSGGNGNAMFEFFPQYMFFVDRGEFFPDER